MKHGNEKIDLMLLAAFLSTLIYACSYPHIHKAMMMDVSDTLISINQIVNCTSSIIIGILWVRYPDKLYQRYPLFCVLETIFGITLGIYFTITNNLAVYYIADTIIFGLITENILCGGSRLKKLRYTPEEREKYDIKGQIITSIATVFGSGVSIVIGRIFDINITILLWAAIVGNMIDNGFYIFMFFKHKK